MSKTSEEGEFRTDEEMSEEGATARDSEDEEEDEEDNKIRREFEKSLPSDLVKFSDLLLQRFENKLEKNKEQIKKICSRAEKRSKEAVEIATESRAVAEEALTIAQNASAAAADNGKQIRALQESVTLMQKERTPTLKPPGVNLLPMSSEEKFQRLESKYSKLVHETNTTTSFRLGRKKGEADADLQAAKALFESFFPGVPYTIVLPPNAKFFRIRALNASDASRLVNLSKSSWVELNAVGWWFGPDIPEDMSRLEARGREFLAMMKGVSEQVKKKIGYIVIENGFMLKSGKELVPLLYIPPASSGKWSQLGTLFLERIDTVRDDWLGMYASSDNDFYVRWLECAGFTAMAKDLRKFSAAKE